MRFRTLGATPLSVSVVGFGAYALGGGTWGPQDEASGVRAVEQALELGMCAIDTAPVYGVGQSERIVARALRGRRERAIVMTKVGLSWDERDDDGARAPEAKPILGPDGKSVWIRRDSRPHVVRAEIEQSLRRLEIERIDLAQIHWPDPRTPLADTLGTLDELRREGKLAHIGVSNFSAAQVAEAVRVLAPTPLASHQLPFGLLTRDAERELVPQALRERIGVLAYGALGQGLLTGAVRADRRFAASEGRARRANFERLNRARVNRVLDDVVAPIARAHGTSIAAVVLAWTAAEPGVTCVLAGARDAAQVRENARGAELELADEQRAAIRAAFERLRLRPASGAGWRAWLRYCIRW